MADDLDVWGKCKPASFAVDGRPAIILPVWDRVEGSGGVRIAAREVPFVDGRQLDDTGCKGDEWSTASPFFNELHLHDPDLGDSPRLYPDRLEKIIETFRLRKTGTLHLPWRRNIRCKAADWRRVATTDQLNGETLLVTWFEDNENKLANPSTGIGVAVSIGGAVKKAVFEAERAGCWDFSWEQLTTLASQLEEVLSMPAQYRDDVLQKATRLARCCDSILTSFTSRIPGRDQLSHPAGAAAHTAVRELRAIAESAAPEARANRPRTRTRFTEYALSIWELAAYWEEDVDELLGLNKNLPDPNYIPAGTPIVVPVF